MPNHLAEKLRILRADDVPAAFQLSAQAGWNQTEEDWRMLLELSPEGCLGVEVDGNLVATTTLLCFGQRLAWIGMVLTKSDYQRRGLAKKLLRHCLEQADRMGVETTKLDATDQGRSLYEKFGFRPEQEIQRWSRPGGGEAPAAAGGIPVGEPWRSLDSLAFGADRSIMLDRLAQRHPPNLYRSVVFVLEAGTRDCISWSLRQRKSGDCSKLDRGMCAAHEVQLVVGLVPPTSRGRSHREGLGFFSPAASRAHGPWEATASERQRDLRDRGI